MTYARTSIRNLDKLDTLVEQILSTARVPGAALAVVADGDIVFAKGYGYRDWNAKLPMTVDTAYPIASASKAINATLLGMLVDEGRLAWDAPVQSYLPRFRLKDPLVSTQVTVRDLITMRTGLPRHDWMWIDNPISRSDLVERLRHLEPSAGFRERFQYNNLTVAVSGHIAESITGMSWEELVQERIFRPLGMSASGFSMPAGRATLSYHETSRRELTTSRRLAAELIAPAGGSIHSVVEDVARWMLFNLSHGQIEGRPLIQPQTLKEIHSPQVVAGPEYAERRPNAAYALGWSVDTFKGLVRLAHGGYLHDVDSEVTLFPQVGIGIVSFANFGPPQIALPMNQRVADLIMGFEPVQTIEQHLASYERKIVTMSDRTMSGRRVENNDPSHPLQDYAGTYVHAGYGEVDIRLSGPALSLRRNQLVLDLEHWHYDVWAVQDNDLFPIHEPHAFSRTSRLSFDTNTEGEIAALSIRLEPTVGPIRFEKKSRDRRSYRE